MSFMKRSGAPSTAAVVTLALCAIAAIVLTQMRGIWLDEAYSLWFAGHDLLFREALTSRWIRDGHPVLYYAYAWALQPLFGASVHSFRLINFGILLFVVATGWQIARARSDRSFYLLFAVLVASTPFFTLYAAEFRSYWAQLVLSACLLAQFRLLERSVEVADGPRRGLLALIAVTGILLVNLHYVASLVGFSLIGCEMLSLALRRQMRAALVLLATGMLGAVGLAVSLAAFLGTTTPTATTHITLGHSLILMAVPLAAPFASNLVAVAGAGVAARRDGRAILDAYGVTLIATLVVIVVLYAGYSALAQNFVSRFLIAAVPIPSALIAHAISRSPAVYRKAMVPICLMAVVVTAGSLLYGLRAKRWETDVALIQAARSACPGTQVIAISPYSFIDPAGALAKSVGTREAFILAYELVARDNGFTIAVAERGKPRRAIAGPCSTLLWLEHRYVSFFYDDRTIARAAGVYPDGGTLILRRLQASPERLLLAATVEGAPPRRQPPQ